MNRIFINLLIVGSLLTVPARAVAQEAWVEITRNSVGDRFLVDQNSIRQEGGFVWYWEYRDFPQPNNAFVDVELDQPVRGVMLYRSVDCDSGVARLRRMVVHGRDRQVIHRAVYNDDGSLSQPLPGSSAAAVLRRVCNDQGG